MVHRQSEVELDVGLLDFLKARARSVSDARLALDIAAGLVATVIGLIWRPFGWHVIVSAALCFMAFGSYGIADRELSERIGALSATSGVVQVLRGARMVSAVLGGLAGSALLISLLGIALGTWIS